MGVKIIPKLTIPNTEWADFYTISEIPVGSTFNIHNNNIGVVVIFSTAEDKPAADDITGWPIGSRNSPTSLQTMPAGATKLWVKALTETNRQIGNVSVMYTE